GFLSGIFTRVQTSRHCKTLSIQKNNQSDAARRTPGHARLRASFPSRQTLPLAACDLQKNAPASAPTGLSAGVQRSRRAAPALLPLVRATMAGRGRRSRLSESSHSHPESTHARLRFARSRFRRRLCPADRTARRGLRATSRRTAVALRGRIDAALAR